jgi:hypothetical protein
VPQPTKLSFSHKEVATALIKHQGISNGIWGLHVRFGIEAMNVGVRDADLQPSAVIPVLSIGLQRFEKLNNLSVDAALVNPRSARASRQPIGARKRKAARTR